MKRDRQAEKEHLLLEAEASLGRALLEVLPTVVNSGEQIFLNSGFHPAGFPVGYLSEQGEMLFQKASACVAARESLGLADSGSVGQLFLEACAESASSDEHRRGPRKLAAWLLEHVSRAACQ